MNHVRPNFYRRVRLFCELPIHIVSSATGISSSRLQGIETGQREPNPTEQRILERFLLDKLEMTIQMDGPIPAWLSGKKHLLTEPTP